MDDQQRSLTFPRLACVWCVSGQTSLTETYIDTRVHTNQRHRPPHTRDDGVMMMLRRLTRRLLNTPLISVGGTRGSPPEPAHCSPLLVGGADLPALEVGRAPPLLLPPLALALLVSAPVDMRRSRSGLNICRPSGLVKISASWSRLGTHSSRTSFSRTDSWMKWCRTSMCLVRLWAKPTCAHIASADWLSVKITVGSRIVALGLSPLTCE